MFAWHSGCLNSYKPLRLMNLLTLWSVAMKIKQIIITNLAPYTLEEIIKIPRCLLLACIVLLPGCAAVALTAGGLAAGVGVNYTMSGIAYQTVVAPLPDTRLATLKTLNRMEMNISRDEATDEGWQLTADAADRQVNIELEKVTPTTTRMRVTVDKGHAFLKDRATATEIIAQSVLRLEQDQRTAQADAWGN
jgi:hypothetical protein